RSGGTAPRGAGRAPPHFARGYRRVHAAAPGTPRKARRPAAVRARQPVTVQRRADPRPTLAVRSDQFRSAVEPDREREWGSTPNSCNPAWVAGPAVRAKSTVPTP